MYVCMYVFMQACMYVYIRVSYIYIADIYMCVCVCVYVCVYVCIYVCMHVCIHLREKVHRTMSASSVHEKASQYRVLNGAVATSMIMRTECIMYMYVCMPMYLALHVDIMYMCMYAYVSMYACIYVCVGMYVCR